MQMKQKNSLGTQSRRNLLTAAAAAALECVTLAFQGRLWLNEILCQTCTVKGDFKLWLQKKLCFNDYFSMAPDIFYVVTQQEEELERSFAYNMNQLYCCKYSYSQCIFKPRERLVWFGLALFLNTSSSQVYIPSQKKYSKIKFV